MRIVFRFLQRKVPLWILLLTGIIIAVESIQIVAEIKFHSEQRSYYIESVKHASDGIYQNLEYIFPNKDDDEKVTQSIIGAYLYSNDLFNTRYFIPKWTVFGVEKDIYRGYSSYDFLTFGYVNSILEQMLNEYKKTYHLSESDYETLQLFCKGFRDLSEEIEEKPHMSNKQFVDCIEKLYTAVYLKQ